MSDSQAHARFVQELIVAELLARRGEGPLTRPRWPRVRPPVVAPLPSAPAPAAPRRPAPSEGR